MATNDPYTTKAIIKARLNITGSTYDDAIDGTILSASRQIDNWCGQSFAQSASEARYYTGRFDDTLTIDPLVSVSEIKSDSTGNGTYATTWDAADYVLLPRNASGQSRPYTEIRVAWGHSLAFPLFGESVKVTGVFGWPAVPAPIVEACNLQASRLWARTKSPDGLAGTGDFAAPIVNLDPDVKLLIAPYRVMVV